MDNNKLLLALRGALDMADEDVAAVFHLSGRSLDAAELTGLLGDHQDSGFLPCTERDLRHFLEGLILAERGPREDGTAVVIDDSALDNNQVLKKIRIAFNLQELDMLAIFEEGGASLSVAELGALFRKESNKHFRPCSDALLESFLAGLTPSLDA